MPSVKVKEYLALYYQILSILATHFLLLSRLFDITSANGKLAIESKVGRLSRGKFQEEQIIKDIRSLIEKNKKKIIWISTPNKKGKVGFTDNLVKYAREKLKKQGLPEDLIKFKASPLIYSDLIID